MDHWNGLLKTTKVETFLGTDDNGTEAKRCWKNSYVYVIGIILYLASTTKVYISFVVHHCVQFTHKNS